MALRLGAIPFFFFRRYKRGMRIFFLSLAGVGLGLVVWGYYRLIKHSYGEERPPKVPKE